MKTVSILSFLICVLVGCGYESRSNELIGQVKKTVRNTPIVCEDYDAADISLGVMRNGVGSMSTGDEWLYVPRAEDMKTLREANESGAIVRVRYSVRRVTFCVPEHWVDGVEIMPSGDGAQR